MIPNEKPLTSTLEEKQQPRVLVVASMKNPGLAIALGVFFGSLGLLYSTITGALVMFGVNVIAAIFTLGFGLILTWPICGVWAYVAAKKYNERLIAAGGGNL